MLKKLLKSNRGSTMILILITISVLSLLGTAILSLSLINYKMKLVDRNVKTSLYLTEAGIEEAYGEIGKVIEQAIISEKSGGLGDIGGNKYVEQELNNFIKRERMKEQFEPGPEEDKYNSPYLENPANGYGAVDEEAIKPKLQEWFRIAYTEYINNNLLSKLEEKYNNDGYGIVESSINTDNAEVKVLDTSKEDNYFPFEDNNGTYKITLQSKFTHNKVEKQIKAQFIIDIPKYGAPYYVKNKMAKISENILWKKAITAEGNLYVNGENTVINGDIYAYGTSPSNDQDKKDPKNFGGIVVGNSEGDSITINGTASTNGYIQTNHDNTSITLNGNGYCDSLVIREDTEDCSIAVNGGDLNTRDDLELNGEDGIIAINGGYYGFSDGSEISSSHDNSSSIVINSSDIGEAHGSSLSISGNVYIGGTVYINLTSGEYQTGESISLRGNYRAYGGLLKDDGKNPRFLPENIRFKNNPPLVLADGFIDTNKKLLVGDKSKYIVYYDKDYGDLRLGGDNGININKNNILHSTGAFIGKGEIHGSRISVDNDIIRENKVKYFKHSINNMADTKINNIEARDIDDRELNTRIYIEQSRNKVGRFLFDTNIDIFEDKEFVLSNDDESKKLIIKEFIFSNNNDNKKLVIKGPDGYIPGGIDGDDRVLDISDSSLKGIILTKGDVYLTGKLEYEGIIVTEGNVYINGNNISITNNEDTQKYLIRKIYELNGNDGKPDLKSKFVNNGQEKKFLYESETAADDIESYIKYEDVVDLIWNKVK